MSKEDCHNVEDHLGVGVVAGVIIITSPLLSKVGGTALLIIIIIIVIIIINIVIIIINIVILSSPNPKPPTQSNPVQNPTSHKGTGLTLKSWGPPQIDSGSSTYLDSGSTT